MKTPIRVLLAEDNPDDAELVVRELRRAGFEPDWKRVDTAADFTASLHSGLELILSDYEMPQFGGPRALELLQASGLDVPFFIISGTIGEENAVAMIKQGAADYLLKDRLARLGSAVTHALENQRLRAGRRQAEAETQRQRAELQLILDAVPALVFYKDRESRFVRVNQELARMVGLPPDAFVGKTDTELGSPYGERHRADDLKVITSGEPIRHLEEQFQAADGPRWLLTDKVPHRDETGHIIGIVGFAVDITGRKVAAESLTTAEAKFRNLVEQSLVGIYVVQDDRFAYVNPKMAEMLGYTGAELTSAPLATFIHPEDWPVARENVRQRLSGEIQSAHYFLRMMHKNGGVIEAEARGAQTEYGGRPAIMGSLLDISERKRAEKHASALASLGQRLSAAKTAKEAGAVIVEVADKLFGWDGCTLDLYQPGHNRVRRVLNMDLVDGRRTDCPLPYEETEPTARARRVIEQGAQLILRAAPFAMSPESIPFGDTARASASIMEVPIREGASVIGILSVQSYRPNAYTERELAALQTLGDHCGGALQRIRTNEALAEEHNLLRTLIDNLPGYIYVKDTAGRYLIHNHATTVALGASTGAEIIGKTVFDLFPPEIARVFDADDRIVVQTNQAVIDREEPYIMKGQRGWFSTTKVPLRDARGNVTGLVGFSADITARKKVEARAAALSSLGQKLGSAKTALEAGEVIVEVADQLFGWDCCTLDSYSPEKNRVYRILNRDVIDGRRTDCVPVYDNVEPTPRMRRVIEHGAQLILRDPDGPMPSDSVPFGDKTRASASLMLVPIRESARVIGVLSLQSYTAQAYTRADLELLQALADHCGGALERIRTGEALQEAEKQYRSIFENAVEGLFQTMPEGRFVTVNPAYASILGYASPEELVQQCTDIARQIYASPGDRDEFKRQLEATGTVINFEHQVRRKDGSKIWISSNARVVRDHHGRTLLYEGSIENITIRKQAEQALAGERNLLRTLIDNLPAHIFVKDTAGHYLISNRSHTRLLGAGSDVKTAGKTAFDFFPPDVARSFHDDDQAVLQHDRPVIEREEPFDAEGKRGWFSTTKVPLHDDHDRVIGLIGIKQVITERKLAELRGAALSGLGQKLSATKTAAEAGSIIMQVADELFGWDASFLDLYSAENNRLHRVLNQDTMDGRHVDCPSAYDDEVLSPLIQKVIEQGAQLILKEPPYAMMSGSVPFGDTARPSASLMFVPMRDGANVIGTLSIQSYTPKAYNSEDLALLQSLADHCGGALERIRAEEIARIAHGRLQQLLAHSPAVIYSLKLAGQKALPALTSENITQLLGFSVEEALHIDWWPRQVHPDDLKQTLSGISEILAAGAITREYRVRHKAGHYIWVEDNQRLIRDASGQPAEIAGVWTDITARKEAEAELRESNERFKMVSRATNDAVWDWNLTTNMVWWNEGFQALFGYTPEETDATIASRIDPLHPDDLARVKTGVFKVIDGGGHYWSDEYRFRRRDGTYATILDRGFVLRTPEGKAVRMIGAMMDITERKRTEEELRWRTAFFEAQVDSSIDGLLVVDGEGNKILQNERFNELWQFPRDIVAEKDDLRQLQFAVSRTRHPEQFAARVKHLYAQRDEVSRDEIELVDGTVMDRYSAPVKDKAGKYYGRIWAFRDITERKQAEAVLAQRTRLAALGADIGVALTRAGSLREILQECTKAMVRHLDAAFARIWTLNEAENMLELQASAGIYTHLDGPHGRVPVGQYKIGLIAQERKPRLTNAVVGDPQVSDQEWAKREGMVAFAGYPLLVENRLVGVVAMFARHMLSETTLAALGSVADGISLGIEHKQGEDSLRASEARFRQLAENIHEVFWMTDPTKQQMLYISPGYEKIWGRTCESLYRSPDTWANAIHPEDRPRVLEAAMSKQVAGTYDEIYRITRPDGSTRWIHDRAFPIRNEQGEVYRVVGTAEDITGKRSLEAQLRQAQKMEAIGTLAGGIAHDFNNILAAINGFTELAKLDTEGNPTVSEYLDEVTKAGWRATDLVRQILTFSRQTEQQRKQLQLRHIVAEAFKLLRATIPSSIQFSVNLATDAPVVLADATQVHQIAMNLGTNAAHAMRGRSGLLEVKLVSLLVDSDMVAANPSLHAGPYALLTISDTGHGMPREVLERIFEPFFTTKAPGEGTGLGLSVVHGIMQTHEGCITVYSQPGQGTTFHLYFPAAAAEESVVTTSEVTVPTGNGECVLFVDDEEALARLGQRMLVRLGYQVVAFTSPGAALEAFQLNPQKYALVITDLTMPGMTGIKLAPELLKIRADVPIILTTGYAANLTLNEVHALGIRELVMKPLSRQALGEAIHRVLNLEQK